MLKNLFERSYYEPTVRASFEREDITEWEVRQTFKERPSHMELAELTRAMNARVRFCLVLGDSLKKLNSGIYDRFIQIVKLRGIPTIQKILRREPIDPKELNAWLCPEQTETKQWAMELNRQVAFTTNVDEADAQILSNWVLPVLDDHLRAAKLQTS